MGNGKCVPPFPLAALGVNKPGCGETVAVVVIGIIIVVVVVIIVAVGFIIVVMG